jgi:peptide/nickel transport system substrate-binding protein
MPKTPPPRSSARWLPTVPRPIIAIAAAAFLVATGACSGGGSDTDLTAGVSTTAPVQQGGEIVIGAEQEPDCTDWIATCGGSVWGAYMMKVTTIPVAFDVRKEGEDWVPVASNLLAGEPVAELTDDGGQTVTYSINPDAVWSDGTPITSADFKYTAVQIRDGDDVFDKTGYSNITDVETPNDQTAIVKLSAPFAGWKALFSSTYGVLPAHLLEGKDRSAIMKDGYDFSGGPFIIDSWDRGTGVTLVPNDNYWGTKPVVDKVTFTFIPDTAAAFQALKSGQVDALYPTPQLDAISQIKAGLPGVTSQVDGQSGNLEGLWMNNKAFPFDSQAVRQAFSYSLDRQAIVERLFGDIGVEEPAQSFLSPIVSLYASDDFAKYSLDLDQVNSLMTSDGWAKNSDGIWAKDDKPAAFTMVSLAGNKRRDLTMQIMQAQLKEAGFDMAIKTTTPADLFGKLAPSGDFQIGLWTLVDYFPEPALSGAFSSTSIPTESNGYSGFNFGGTDIKGLDALLTQVNVELDVDARIAASHEAEALIADAVASLPLDAVPNVLLSSDKLGGPLSINPAEGPFWNLEEWGLAE